MTGKHCVSMTRARLGRHRARDSLAY